MVGVQGLSLCVLVEAATGLEPALEGTWELALSQRQRPPWVSQVKCGPILQTASPRLSGASPQSSRLHERQGPANLSSPVMYCRSPPRPVLRLSLSPAGPGWPRVSHPPRPWPTPTHRVLRDSPAGWGQGGAGWPRAAPHHQGWPWPPRAPRLTGVESFLLGRLPLKNLACKPQLKGVTGERGRLLGPLRVWGLTP